MRSISAKPKLYPVAPRSEAMRALQKTDRAQYDKLAAEARKNATALAPYDEEAIAAVDKFRAAQGLSYAGNPPGLVDGRLVEALRAAYLKKKTGKTP